MRPIRFFTHRQTLWYNLFDYVQLLLDTGIIRPLRSAPLYKRKAPAKSVHDLLTDKINRLKPIYRLRIEDDVYIDWAVFEHLYRLIRPYLIDSDDWMNPESLFRQLQLAIDRPKRSPEVLSPETMVNYFTEIHPGNELSDKP